ncbi:MAG: terpene cyclase/mutase family protein [Planctomycetes bacterium]|nr:terpene cyclase/mutase family protein [Planctomycetota bacterium]
MNTLAPPVRTHRSPADEATFQDLMAERLRQAPWLALSAALHAVLLALIWVFVPGDRQKPTEVRVAVQPTEQVEVEPPPPPKPPETRREDDVEETPIVDTDVAETPDDSPSEFDSEVTTIPSAFDSVGDNPAVGLGGGAAGPYGARGTRGKGPGGGHAPQPNVERGLEWLAAHQDEDGKWDADGFMKHDDATLPLCTGPGNPVHDIGVTGLALLAFLGDGHTMRAGSYQDVVKRGVLWLRAQQEENGRFGAAASSDFVYDHAIATYALCEACGLSASSLLRPTVQKALAYLEAHRNPYSVWRYQPRDGDRDLSVTAWCVMAYESARFFGFAVNEQALKLAAVYLDEVSDATGRHGYMKAGEPSSRKVGGHAARFPVEKGEAMTAVGLFCRFFLGQDPREAPVMKAAAARLLTRPPVWDEKSGSIDHYYWYYATYALFQVGGPQWRAWQQQVERAVGRTQHQARDDKNRYGSWDPVGVWGDDGGRVYSTAILTLTMQANYRYTRLVR